MAGQIRNLLSQEQLAALGEIAVASTELESSVGAQISMALNLKRDDYEVIVGPMSLSTRLEALRKLGLARIKGKKTKEKFQRHIEHLKTLVAHRNTVIHGWWRPMGKGLRLWDVMAYWSGRFKPPGVEVRNKKRSFDAAKLEQLANDIDAGNEMLFKIGTSSWLKGKYKEADLHALVDD
jgi:hypothetical protein